MSSLNAEAKEWDGDLEVFADPEERRVLFAALDSFRTYRNRTHFNVTHRRRQAFYALPSSQWQMLAEPPFSLLQNLSDVDDAIDCNADIADDIFECGLRSFQALGVHQLESQDWYGSAEANDEDKAYATISQFYRDWSVEGLQERRSCFDYIFGQLRGSLEGHLAYLHPSSPVKVLVPGAGLGRLVYDLCQAGFDVEGNEISYHQLLASSWVLNHASPTGHTLFPFATHFTNLLSRKQQQRRVTIPDVHPAQDMELASANGEKMGRMNMTAGDFVKLYKRKQSQDTFDAVTTMFFVDTAPNLIRYVDTVRNCLKANGVWINVGPLLWHFDSDLKGQVDHTKERYASQAEDREVADIGERGSFELTEEEVIWLLEKKGFHIERREVVLEGLGYMQEPESMLQSKYSVCRWVARKKPG